MSARLVSLGDFIPAVSPRLQRPQHLAPLLELFERSRSEEVCASVSVPPRHAKTTTVLHGCVWRLADDPSTRIGYFSHSQRFAEKQGAKMRELARRVGVPVSDDSQSKADWRTGVEEGGCLAASIGGGGMGEGFDLIIVDDPTKSRATAESQIERDKVYAWFNDTLFTRREPDSSCLVVHQRWHEDDLTGRLNAEGWENITLPAIDAEGRPLWPERWSRERLQEIQNRLGDYSWASLYQGQPFPRGGALFGDVHFYDALPTEFRIGKGCDLAYSARTRADRSCGVVLLESEGLYYVADVRTAQVKVPQFLSMLAAVDTTYAGSWTWHASGTEKGVADLANEAAGVRLHVENASADKFVRSQGVAAAWNAGKVLLPRSAPWLDRFVAEVCGFTGLGDRRDDQVDALASAFSRIGWGTGPVTLESYLESGGCIAHGPNYDGIKRSANLAERFVRDPITGAVIGVRV